MKKKISIIFILILTGMGVCACTVNLNEKQQEAADAEQTGKENENDGKTDVIESAKEPSVTAGEISHQISGYELVDGDSVPVTVTFTLKNVQRGEEAYEFLVKENPDIAKPQEGMEYVVATIHVSYDEGEAETLYLAKNEASLQSAKLYFTLPSEGINGEDMTESVADGIYYLELQKGQSGEGLVVFLHNIGGQETLYFTGFENVIQFDLKK